MCRHAAELKEAGGDTIIANNTEAGTALGSSLLQALGSVQDKQLLTLVRALRAQMQARSAPVPFPP